MEEIFTIIFCIALFGFGIFCLYGTYKDYKACEYKEYKIKKYNFPITFERKYKTIDFRKLPTKQVKNKDITFIFF